MLNVVHPSRWLNLPEWNVGVFSLLLNFFWEIQQMPFYQLPSEFSCFDMIRNCTFATIGDVGISLLAFWVVAALAKSRQWFHQPWRSQLTSFIFVGVITTVVFEALAIGVLKLWAYAAFMPTLPFLGSGLLPLLQWLLLPPILIWFVKRQLSDTSFRSAR
ncbi:MAG: hypothetical protein LH660_10940 [Phormidesmis sp. CAN_BIN36]|nr:hypothetical protein [Phormidesmis sp. CAN_BIN36]